MAASLTKLRWFSYGRQRLGRAATDAATALRDVVAVYSSHPSAPLSLFARTRELDFAALDRPERSLRLPAMRGSIHLVPRDSAPELISAPDGAGELSSIRLRNFKLTVEDYERYRDTVLAVAREPLSGKELRERAGVPDEHWQGVLGTMTRDECVLLRVGAPSPRSNALRYVACDAALGRPLKRRRQDRALAWLAGEYLRAFGPVRTADFAWWVGATPARAKAALGEHDTVDVGDGLLLRAEDEADFEKTRKPRADRIDVLPKWDCWTMGYAADGRARIVDPQLQDRVYDGAGDGMPIVLVNGQAAAAWGSRFKGRRMEIDLDLFDKPGTKQRAAIEAAFDEVAALLGADDAVVDAGRGVWRRERPRRRS